MYNTFIVYIFTIRILMYIKVMKKLEFVVVGWCCFVVFLLLLLFKTLINYFGPD